ncbi:hypothetical protein ACFXN2_10930 [Streptomyces kronopolitis]|uniref:hypothetical protein n=1 Tax=Streptomyces kronopolitis TaxID=1612435 RepID=UPI003686B4C1
MHTKTIPHGDPYDRPPSGARGPVGTAASLALGAAAGAGGLGAVLALAGSESPLRAPLALFFLLAAPAGAIAAALGRMDPLGRAVAAGAGALALDLLVAQGMLTLHLWSIRGGVVAVAVCSLALVLVGALPRRAGRAPGRGAG